MKKNKLVRKIKTKKKTKKAKKIPICAAAPNKIVLGFAIIEVKSVIAPNPINIMGGIIFQKDKP